MNSAATPAPVDTIDISALAQTLLARGWAWDPAGTGRILHPENREFYLVCDGSRTRLTPSRALAEHLNLVIPSPPPKARAGRRG